MHVIRKPRDKGDFFVTFAFFLLLALVISTILSLFVSSIFHLVPYFVFLVFCIFLIRVREGFLDPYVIFAIGTFLYGFMPIFSDVSAERLVTVFGTNGAYYIHTIALNAVCLAYILAEISLRGINRNNNHINNVDVVALIALVLCAAISICLESVYSAQQGGFVLLGDLDYSAGFMAKRETGSGVLLLSFPLAMAGLCIMLASNYRFRIYPYVISLLPFLLLFLVRGSRQFFIAPLLIVAARHIRIRNIVYIFGSFLGAAFFWMIFSYLGYLRHYDYSIFDSFEPYVIDGFLRDIGYYIGAETPSLYGTASAAYLNFVKPLPYFGDYLLSWKYSLPQLIFGNDIFVSLNERFAIAYDAVSAAQGMGWGFSFWGEAYLVGGTVGIFLIAFLVAYVFRWIYVKGTAGGISGPFGAVLLASIYHAFWIIRNDFAHFMKEFLIYQIVIIFLMYEVSRMAYFAMMKAKKK